MRFRRTTGGVGWIVAGVAGGLAAVLAGLGDGLALALGTALGLWIRFCDATTRWDRQGEAELEAALAEGPVVLVMWHERLAMAGMHWRERWGPMAALHSTSFSGRMAGIAQGHTGVSPIAMSPRAGNLAASRAVLRQLKGTGRGSVGLTADGPLGPALVPKDAALEWARAAGRPVFLYAFATRVHVRRGRWDRMIWPLPFSRGACVWRRWDADLPRRADAVLHESMRTALTAGLNAIGREADTLARGSGGLLAPGSSS